jgi:hypothetical protein
MGAPFIKPDFAGIPSELRSLPRWLVWSVGAGVDPPLFAGEVAVLH